MSDLSVRLLATAVNCAVGPPHSCELQLRISVSHKWQYFI